MYAKKFIAEPIWVRDRKSEERFLEMNEYIIDSAKCINCQEFFDCDPGIELLLCYECIRIKPRRKCQLGKNN